MVDCGRDVRLEKKDWGLGLQSLYVYDLVALRDNPAELGAQSNVRRGSGRLQAVRCGVYLGGVVYVHFIITNAA